MVNPLKTFKSTQIMTHNKKEEAKNTPNTNNIIISKIHLANQKVEVAYIMVLRITMINDINRNYRQLKNITIHNSKEKSFEHSIQHLIHQVYLIIL